MARIIGRGRYAGETYPERAVGTGGTGSAGAPLSRQRFIDGDTSQPGLNGAAGAPFKTIAQFIASRGAASVADVTANYVGWLMPALNGYAENIAFPRNASTELRADSISVAAGSGTIVTGSATWANTAAAPGATAAILALHNITLTGGITITDAASSPSAEFVFASDEVGLAGSGMASFDSSTTQNLAAAVFTNAAVNGNLTAGVGNSNAVVELINTEVIGNITGKALSTFSAVLTGSFITTGGTAGTPSATFQNSEFAAGSAPTLTAVGGARFDGPSWRSFLEAGGIRGSGLTVLITGGYNGAAVEGAAITAATTNVSLNGVGADAGFTGEHSGNHYSVSGTATPTLINLLSGGGELLGDTILITRLSSDAISLNVRNGGGGSIGTIPSGSRGFILAQWNGAIWQFAAGGSLTS